MLAIFRRYTSRLSEQSVGHALHSVLGGAPDGFHVLQESPRHFCFAVASKDVGLFIASKRRIVAESFDVYFHLGEMVARIGPKNSRNGSKKKIHSGLL